MLISAEGLVIDYTVLFDRGVDLHGIISPGYQSTSINIHEYWFLHGPIHFSSIEHSF